MVITASRRTRLLPFILLFIAILFTVTGELLLKRGMNLNGVLELSFSTLGPTVLRLVSNPFIVLGFTSIFAGSIFWLSVISRIDLSLAYPLLSTSYVLVVLASWLFLGEHLPWPRVLGVAVIILGVFLVFRSGQ